MLLKLLFSLSLVLWREWEELSMIVSSLASILSLTTSSRLASLKPTTDPACQIEFVQSVGMVCFNASSPVHHSKENCACHDRLVKHVEHPATNIEGPESPHKVESTYAPLVASMSVDHSSLLYSRTPTNL